MSGRPTAGSLALALLASVPQLASALEIDWYTIDGGGGTSIAADLALTGTIGQADAGPLSAGSLTLQGGFWASAGATATGVPGGLPGGESTILPTVPRLASNAPNPFRERTALRFDLPREVHARIRVYDVAGRLVRTLVDRPLEAGTHEAAWDGRDTGGSRVASGIYLVRMQAGDFGATRKITRLK